MGSLTTSIRFSGVLAITLAAWAARVCLGGAQEAAEEASRSSEEMFRDGFEDAQPIWVEEGGDVRRTLRFHDRTNQTAHSGEHCERIGISAASGTHLYFSYPIARVLVTEDLKISLWVKSDRPGVQVLARVVFPRERDPNTLQLLGTLVPGSSYDQTGRWQRLELERAAQVMERQARLLRASLKRNLDTREAYVDRVLINVYSGPGDSQVFLDDLEVGPIVAGRVELSGAVLGPPGEAVGPNVSVSQDRLLVGGRPRLMRAIRASGIAPATLKEFGFNALAVEWPLDVAEVDRAVTAGLWLLPQLPDSSDPSQPPERPLAQVLGELPFRESVLSWQVGMGIGPEMLDPLAQRVQELRDWSRDRPVAADVTGNLWAFSRELDMLSAHRWPVGTSLELRGYRDWLTQRRYLARPGTYFFSWVQAGESGGAAVEAVPQVGPEPDQLRLLTYTALAAGCRGLAFWSDDSLGEPGAGRQRLLQLGLLNLELQLLEPYFASAGTVSTVSVETASSIVKRGPGADSQSIASDQRGMFSPRRGVTGSFAPQPKPKPVQKINRNEVQATMLHCDRVLVAIPVWYGKGAQFVAGQLATNNLNVLIPGVPDAAQAWQITPASMRMITKRERIVGGTRLTLPEFDLTGVVILTSDTAVLDQIRREIAKTAPWAALWSAELATSLLDTVKSVDSELVELGRGQPDGLALVQAAERHLGVSRSAIERGDHATSYAESQRALRALRILKRAHWEAAIKGLSAPQASPYATSFANLPHHWRLMREVTGGEFGPNLISAGDFESAEALADDGWTQHWDHAEGLTVNATLSAEQPHAGDRSLHLQLRPSGDQQLPAAFDPMLAALISKPIPVNSGDVLRIRFWMRVPTKIRGSVDGAQVFDSSTGPALAITHSEPLEWKQHTVYRRITRSEPITVTLGLTGVGDVYIDDLEIRRLIGPAVITQEQKPSNIRR